jgi:hypothetical protein
MFSWWQLNEVLDITDYKVKGNIYLNSTDRIIFVPREEEKCTRVFILIWLLESDKPSTFESREEMQKHREEMQKCNII